MSDRDRLSEEEAARLWQRAAQLQGEAVRRAELSADREAEAEAESTALTTADGYALEHVRAAAIEAGIGAEYLDAAVADLRAERTIARRGGGGRYARFLLGEPPDAITVSRVIEARPERVLRTMEEIVPHEPYKLVLRDRQGDPLDGGLLVFDIGGAGFAITEGFTGSASHADLREVLITLRPAPGSEGAATELTVRGPVAWAHRLNAGIGTVVVGVSGAAGLGVATPLSGWLSAVLFTSGMVGTGGAAAVAAAVTVIGAGVGAAAGTGGFRVLYRFGLNKGIRGLEGLLSVIAVRAQGGWGLERSP